MTTFTSVMPGKRKRNFYLPKELLDALDKVAERVNGKEKWLAVGAAIVALINLSEDKQNELIRQVKNADLPGGSFDDLVPRPRAKRRANVGRVDKDNNVEFSGERK